MTRIAIVDDDLQCAEFMAETLELEGYRVHKYHQADGTFALLREILPDLIVLDVFLERRDSGWLVLDLLQTDPRTCAIPVIVCTADIGQLRTRGPWLQERGIPVLAKPFDLDDLYLLVERSLRTDAATALLDA